MCDCKIRVHPDSECGGIWCRCHPDKVFIVDLNTWEPGEDVDADALVKSELLNYRELNAASYTDNDPCQHLRYRTFYTEPIHTKCLDCGALMETTVKGDV